MHLNASVAPDVVVATAFDRSRAAESTAAKRGCMVQITREGRIVETAREARQGERGPSVLIVLTVSMVAVAVVLAVLWYLFIT